MKLFYVCVIYYKKISKSPLLFLFFFFLLSRCLQNPIFTEGSPRNLFLGFWTTNWLLYPTTRWRLTNLRHHPSTTIQSDLCLNSSSCGSGTDGGVRKYGGGQRRRGNQKY
ncbi:hypothetical protein CXB51_002461 [Gossypium anomalum]|uniref:Uncharacterized protein n=1 Tax=Gossypium anomalum TaxID=47600 RepID=A0A8J5ZS83_9ROSI|nr:hypothetical protein CXB51_002461 [Gossypium anomalum]